MDKQTERLACVIYRPIVPQLDDLVCEIGHGIWLTRGKMIYTGLPSDLITISILWTLQGIGRINKIVMRKLSRENTRWSR